MLLKMMQDTDTSNINTPPVYGNMPRSDITIKEVRQFPPAPMTPVADWRISVECFPVKEHEDQHKLAVTQRHVTDAVTDRSQTTGSLNLISYEEDNDAVPFRYRWS